MTTCTHVDAHTCMHAYAHTNTPTQEYIYIHTIDNLCMDANVPHPGVFVSDRLI